MNKKTVKFIAENQTVFMLWYENEKSHKEIFCIATNVANAVLTVQALNIAFQTEETKS